MIEIPKGALLSVVGNIGMRPRYDRMKRLLQA